MLLGAHSPKLDAVRGLRTKAGRREAGRFTLEGPTLLEEAVRSGLELEAVYATERAYSALGALAERIGAPVFLIPDKAMSRLSELDSPPGIVAVAPLGDSELGTLLDGRGPLLLLAGVADPGNAGTLLRSAEIFGFAGVIFARDGVEPHNPKVVRAAMGALFRVPHALAAAEEVVTGAREREYMLIATSNDGQPLPDFRFERRSIVAVGNERHGVAGWLPSWDRAVAIPQPGGGESLNAAVAGSIVAYAASQQLSTSAERSEKA
jgi:TrmH family RNA methyltransferase